MNLILCFWLIIINIDRFIDQTLSETIHNKTLNLPLARVLKSIDSTKHDDDKSLTFTDPQQYSSTIYKNFQINKNSIIKTHDSRSLGAKYLNEIELSSNEDCLLFCWNTTNCNLAVFEEKTRGSCYLFDCGSVQDFKCRFASHSFYTSSILKINRNSFLLNEWKSQASQENDLAGLKEKMTKIDSVTVKNSETNVPHQLINLQPQLNKLETTTSLTKVSKCRHYQFECRNNSECIAIYNVCDGIAQCSDGSDEADELECHKSRLNNKNYIDIDNNRNGAVDIEKNFKSPSTNAANTGNNSNRISTGNFLTNYLYNIGQGDVQTKSSSMNKFSLNNINYNYPKSPNEKMIDDGSLYRNHLSSNDNSNAGYLFNPNVNNNRNQYPLTDGKQTQSIPVFDVGHYSNANSIKESVYWPSFKYQTSGDNFHHQSPLGQGGQPGDISLYNNNNNNVPESMMDDQIRSKMHYQIQSQLPMQQYLPGYVLPQIPGTNQPIMPQKQQSVSGLMNISNINPTLKTIIELNGNYENNNGNRAQNKTMTKYSYSHISSHDKLMIKSPNIVAISYLHDNGPQNGRETNSAVIALTLGLFITSILIVIVGCRMKSFKKRIIRRGRSLAHDADYLINGMYL